MNDKKYCLVTSSDERCWDDTAPLIFMDAGCLRYPQMDKVKNREYIINKTRFEDFEEYKKGQIYVQDLCNRLIDDLADSLSNIHNVKYDTKSWNILLRWWLLTYVSYYYYRYTAINDLSSRFNIYIKQIPYVDSISFFGNEFAKKVINSDIYNNYSAVRLCERLGINIENLSDYEIYHEKQIYNGANCKNNLKSFLFDKPISLLEHISKNNKIVLYQNPCEFQTKYLIKAVFNNKVCLKSTVGESEFAFGDLEKIYEVEARKRIEFKRVNSTQFERIICDLIKEDMPTVYLENFSQILEKGIKMFGKNKSFFFSRNAWMNDDFVQIYIANERSKGMKLCGIQHGGGGIFCEDLWSSDLLLTDIYYSWGWKKEKNNQYNKVMPSPKLSIGLHFNPKNKQQEKASILFVGNIESNYLRRFFFFPFMINIYQYIEFQINLIKELDENISNFRCRLYQSDYGWNIRERINDAVSDLNLDSPDKQYLDSLSDVKLCIFDNLVTTWTEAYIRGIPFIIVIPPEMEDYLDDVKPKIAKLKEVQVYFNHIKDAVEVIKKIEYNVSEWWNEPERKRIVDDFAQKYTMHSYKWQKEWLKELKKYSVKSN